MRDATGNLFPTFAVWENVMGSLSSGNRLDFGAVLSAFAGRPVSMPVSGKWANAGMVRGGRPDIAWRLMDAQYWARPPLARRKRIFLLADFRGRRTASILFRPPGVLLFFGAGGPGWNPTAPGDRGPFLETGGRVPIVYPFQMYRMRAAAVHQNHTQFTGSFGKRNDPFPTILASKNAPFSFWYEDNPAGGCVRYLTERETERLMGLPDGWTEFGAAGERISPTQRYMALGNSIALPCAFYIMEGIRNSVS